MKENVENATSCVDNQEDQQELVIVIDNQELAIENQESAIEKTV